MTSGVLFRDTRREGVTSMRLLTFMIVSVLVALAAVVLSLRGGATVGSAIFAGVIALVALQVLYAAFLAVVAALSRRGRKPPRD